MYKVNKQIEVRYMGFFNKLKRNVQLEIKKASTPEGCVYWQGWNVPLYKNKESLSNDIDTLRKMRMYYGSSACTDISNKDEIIKVSNIRNANRKGF